MGRRRRLIHSWGSDGKKTRNNVGTCSNQQSMKEANSGALVPSHGRSGHGD